MMSTTTVSYRRSQFILPPPVAGDLIHSKTGRSVLKVVGVRLFRRAGEPASRDMIRMEVERVSAPDDAAPNPWPIAQKPEQAPPEAPPSRPFNPVLARATAAAVAPAKSRKQRRREMQRIAKRLIEDQDGLIPKAQREAVKAPDGTVFSGPKVTASAWRDPDDTNVRSRVPKMVNGGFRRYDPIRQLYENGTISLEHRVAAIFYAEAYERGPGASISASRELIYFDKQNGCPIGPAEHRCDNMATWVGIQARIPSPAQILLQAIVLDNIAPSAWAVKQKTSRDKITGKLIFGLDLLEMIFEDQVRNHIKTERAAD